MLFRLSCSQCILQWTYTAGNNWGVCANGTGELGCGPQETFRLLKFSSLFDSLFLSGLAVTSEFFLLGKGSRRQARLPLHCNTAFPDFIWEFSSFRLPRSQTTQPLTWTSLKITTTSCSAARTTTSMPSTDPTGRRRTLNLQVWWQFKQRDWSWFTRNLCWQKLWRVSVTWSPKARRRRRSEKEKRSEGRLPQCSPPPPPTPHTPHTLHNL